jgi:hypothetical protein
VRIYNNPEVEGFSPPMQGDWRASDWHKDRVYLDPKKKDYVERIVDWSRSAHPKFKQGFEGGLAAQVRSPVSTALPEKEARTPISDRLHSLDELLRQKLINPEEHERKRAEIIKSL